MSYLIHFNPNHDPKTGQFTFSKTAAKVAGIAAGHYSDKELSDKEAKEIANKYKNYKYLRDENDNKTDEYYKLRKKFESGKIDYDEYRSKELFDEHIYDGIELLFWQRADRIAKLKEYMKKSDEEAEEAVKYIDAKIQNYLKTGEAYVKSAAVQKQLSELGLKTEDVWDSKKIYEEGKKEGDRAYNLTVDYNKLYSKKQMTPLRPYGARRVFEPESYAKRGEYGYKYEVEKLEKDYNELQTPNSKKNQQLTKDRVDAFRKKYGY